MIKLASGFALLASIASLVGTPTANAGTPVRDNNFEYTVVDAVNIGPRLQTPDAWRDAYGMFEVVTVKITNIGGKRNTYFGSMELVDDQGRVAHEDSAASIKLPTPDTTFRAMDVGESTTIRAVFDIPTDAHPSHVVMQDLLSDEVHVPL
ncbi:DUF4352 domain-containing protein [Nocardia sp. CDC153]|uniref:DUF4352 domain-containing protein n=1 Tax=Nocardia sp. CDC153 TaxID=3112167 RepID=UPI002DBD3E40|nr:DUF4352 domain-containing protein [Nocardia sp. CDC153]MEC3952524.1 DUF4352 domain-containing protein [Nocardia sp. CDC153]